MVAKNKMYAKISDYGDVVVPMALMEKILEQGYLISTAYQNGRDAISEVRKPDRLHIYSYDEIEAALAQQALQGD